MSGPSTELTRAEIIAKRRAAAVTFFRLLHQPGDVFEVRGLGIGEYDNTFAGFFDNPETAAAAAINCDLNQKPRGVYLTLNPVKSELLASINNRMRRVKRGETSSDRHVVRRRWIIIDLDPQRAGGVSGIATTNAEREVAITRAIEVRNWLTQDVGWSAPVELDSGNGRYLIFPIDLPNDPAALQLIKRILEAISTKWSDDAVKIDTTMSNAARIIRLLGTTNRKGDPTSDRPHRLCNGLYAPDYLENGWADPIAREKLEAVGALSPPQEKKSAKTPRRAKEKPTGVAVLPQEDSEEFKHRLLVEAWLQAYEWNYQPSHIIADGRCCWPLVCPFNPDHGFDAAVLQADNGALSFHCHHDSCSGNGWKEAKSAIGKPDREHYDPPLPEPPSLGRPEKQTELENSARLVSAFGDVLIYVASWGKWFYWTGSRWTEDVGNVITMRHAKDVARAVVSEALFVMTKEAIEFAQKTAKHSGARAMINLAASDLAVPHSVLDGDTMLLNCQNATIDLRTGKPQDHTPTDYITKLCPVVYDENATCPRWERFLVEVFVSQEMTAFVQRLVGYLLTGNVDEQVLGIFHGSGANGKSTFLTTLQGVLGEYADQAPSTLLTVKKSEQHPTEIAGLFGKRLVVATETETGSRLAESLVKQLTGGDTIAARRMREDFWTFRPTHKLILCTNHRPKVRGTDHAIWRRLLLVPFTQVFEGSRKDKNLPAAFAAEAPGILRWAIAGCLEWQRIGLNPPREVQDAVRDYRSTEDVVGRFVRDCCVIGSSSLTVKFSDLYAALEHWCDDTGDNRPGRKTVGQWLLDHGFEPYHSGCARYRGIGLNA